MELAALLTQVAAGRHPPPDGRVTVLRAPDDRSHGVFAFTGHHLVVADVTPEWVNERLPDGDLSAPLNPPFLGALERATGRRVNNIDVVLVAGALAGAPPVKLAAADSVEHARVARANRYRGDVRAWTCDGGVVVLGRGVAGRLEAAAEVDEAVRGRGLGRALFTAARHLASALGRRGEPVWAQVAPGNAASVRALLEAGYRPTGAEALLVRR